jgi:hypothetical protein
MIWKKLAVWLSILLLIACSAPPRTVTDTFLEARGPFALSAPNSCGTPSSAHAIPVSNSEAANIHITFDFIRRPSGEPVGRLLVSGARSLYGRLVMDGSKVRVQFDGAPARATTYGKPLSPELQAANKSITIQRIGNFYLVGPNGPANATVSFLSEAVKLDGQNFAMPTVNFQRVQRTYTYRPMFNAC